MKKKLYVSPEMEELYVEDFQLLVGSVTGEEPYDDIDYGGVDENGEYVPE